MWLTMLALFHLLLFVLSGTASSNTSLRHLVYLTGQHPLIPADLPEMQTVTHVALAFLGSSLFNDPDADQRADWPLFVTVDAVRAQCAPGTKVLVAIGGWGDTAGFAAAARSDAARRRFARNVAAMVATTGADGVDMDWEYPGGNGEDYKTVPNARKAWEVDAYPLLLAAVRSALGPGAILSAAVPGRPEDIALAFPRRTVPRILQHVDFLNVMAYDLMNRRDHATAHHTGVAGSRAAVAAYVAAGAPAQRLNLGLAYYVKYFRTEHDDCLQKVQQGKSPLGCRTLLLEDPDTGADLGRTGGFAWHDPVPEDLRASFARAQTDGVYDTDGGGYYYWDPQSDLWWTYETPEAITAHKFPRVVRAQGLGGVFAWGLGEDAPRYRHLRATGQAVQRANEGDWDGARDEL